MRSRSTCSAHHRRTSSSSVRPAATRSSRRSRITRPTSKPSSSTRSRSRCSPSTSPTTPATSTKRPDVHLHLGDGRSYLARHKTKYNLVWYVAPDSYAATNAASSGAFVLSESYLYTNEMIKTTLQHLTDNGIMVVQFGELNFQDVAEPHEPLRRDRPQGAPGARHQGPEQPPARRRAAQPGRRPVDHRREAHRVHQGRDQPLPHRPHQAARPAPDRGAGPRRSAPGIVSRLASGTNAQVASIVAHSKKNITAVTDDAPYFWHFSRFRDVIANITHPLRTNDPEDAIGERVLLLLLGIAIVYAAVFLLAPFIAVRRKWRALPAKATSAVYFSALGLGFMFFEITMIQRLVQFLGYPTYSLTVTLATLLVSTGVGALASRPLAGRVRNLVPIVLAVARRAHDVLRVRAPADPRRFVAVDRARGARRGRGGRARTAGRVPGHVHAARARSRRVAHLARRGVRRLGVGRERVLLGHRLGAHDDPVDGDGIPDRAVRGARDLRRRGGRVHAAARPPPPSSVLSLEEQPQVQAVTV